MNDSTAAAIMASQAWFEEHVSRPMYEKFERLLIQPWQRRMIAQLLRRANKEQRDAFNNLSLREKLRRGRPTPFPVVDVKIGA